MLILITKVCLSRDEFYSGKSVFDVQIISGTNVIILHSLLAMFGHVKFYPVLLTEVQFQVQRKFLLQKT